MGRFFNQWSSVRGLIALSAVVFGVEPEATQGALEVVDMVPEIVLGTMGVIEVFRNGSKEPVLTPEPTTDEPHR